MENESKSCPACGLQMDPESIYCSECGTNVLLSQKVDLLEIPTEFVIDEDLMANYTNLQQSILKMTDVEELVDVQKQHHHELDRQYFQLTAPIDKARMRARYEKKDVDDLKNLTWTSLKARIKGEKDELLSKEEKEYLKALAHRNSLIEQQQELKQQVDKAKSQLLQAEELVKKKNSLKGDLENLIKKIGEGIEDPVADKLQEEANLIEEKMQKVEHELFELRSNHSYVINAISLYQQASQKLDGAMSMSTWDLLGGGMIVDSIKRSRLGEARRLAQRGNDQLQRSMRWLKTSSNDSVAHVKDTGFWMDTFFDGFFSDMHARSKIEDSQSSVNRALRQAGRISQEFRSQISDLIEELNSIKQEYEAVASKLEAERIKLLEKYMKMEK